MVKFTEVHDVISADGAVVNDNVPGPEGDGVPLLDLKTLLSICAFALGCARLLDGRDGGIGHINVGHDSGWEWFVLSLEIGSFG